MFSNSVGFYSLSNINIELTSRCNKSCWCCGRRKRDKLSPEQQNYGDIDFELLKKVAVQIPPNVVVQLHNNGEALLYPRFGDAVDLFKNQITNIVTNGKLLVAKADQIIGKLDSLAVSIIENDPEAEQQLEIIKEFLKLKGDKKPYTILRLNGEVEEEKYKELGLLIARRVLHAPEGSFNYVHMQPAVPEIGICWEALHRLSIDRFGNVSMCVRYDPDGIGILGNVKEKTLVEVWRGKKRQDWLKKHIKGQRDAIPLCKTCEYWGIPTNRQPLEKEDAKS